MSLDRTQTFFHQYANDFDAIYGNQNGLIDGVINRLFRKSMRLRFEKSIEGCNPIQGKSVLDVGCGPGHYSITLAPRGWLELTSPRACCSSPPSTLIRLASPIGASSWSRISTGMLRTRSSTTWSRWASWTTCPIRKKWSLRFYR